MIPIGQMKLIQIVLNNFCEHQCCHCSQLVPFQAEHYETSLEQIEKALVSLQPYPGHIGFFGGNPLLHPKFPEACELLRKYVPVKLRRELWCSRKNYDKHKSIIKETFYDEAVAYNEHEENQPCWHQPIQIAIDEVIEDKKLMQRIIDNCWVQQRWSAAITPKGAYFCEIAAARAHLTGSPEGIPVEKGWWKRPLSDFEYQIRELCKQCSACLPMPMKANDKQEWDDVSLKNMRPSKRPCKVYDIEYLRRYYNETWRADFCDQNTVFCSLISDRPHIFEPETDYDKRGYFKDFPGWRPNIYRLTKKHTPEDTK